MIFSPLIVGTMRWGSWGNNLSEKEVQELIDKALSLGLYTFDSADIYGGYTTEKTLGKAFENMGLTRESYQLIGKCGIKYKGGEKPYKVKSYDLSKEYIVKAVEESLENLRTDYLDLLLIHRPSPLMDPEEIARAFSILRLEGKVRNFGVSNFSTQQMSSLLEFVPDLLTNQIEISLSSPEAFFDGRVEQMQSLKLQPSAYSPLGGYFSVSEEKNLRVLEVFEELKEKYNASEAQLLLAFLRKHPSGIVPLVGTSKLSNLEHLSKGLEVEISMEDWFYLLEAQRGHRVP